MKEGLKNKIVSIFEYLSEQISKEILIIDRISNNKENFDRHFTTTSRLKINLKYFGVRISGGIATIEGINQYFKFRTDSIKDILKTDNKIEIKILITEDVMRNLELEIIHKNNNQ